MSLTSILSKEIGRQNIKNWFKDNFPNYGIKSPHRKEVVVTPSLLKSSYSGEIGTAFDYLFRFNIERINNKKIIKKREWAAKKGLNNIQKNILNSDDTKITIGYRKDKKVNKTQFEEFLLKSYEGAEKNYKTFIENGKLTEELLKSVLFLAKLDESARTIHINRFDQDEPEKANELIAMFEIVPWDKFIAKQYCFLNPTFGEGSILVGGTDADLIIDNKLVEIKTNKNLQIERRDLNQLIGYYILSLLGNMQHEKCNLNISEIGFYFARFGDLWCLPLSAYYTYEEFNNRIKKEFIKHVKDRNYTTKIKQ